MIARWQADEAEARCNAATPGPYFVADDDAEDTVSHAYSGLALVDTGRHADWPIARLCEWRNARMIAGAGDPESGHRATLAALREAMEVLEEAAPLLPALAVMQNMVGHGPAMRTIQIANRVNAMLAAWDAEKPGEE